MCTLKPPLKRDVERLLVILFLFANKTLNKTDDHRFTSALAVMSLIVAGVVVSKRLEREQDEMERTP
jgi:hypothetical protein